MQRLEKRLVIELSKFTNDRPDHSGFENLHAKLTDKGPTLSADISESSPAFSDFAHMYPGYSLLVHIEDISRLSSADAAILDDWIFSHTSSVILHTHKVRFLPKRWQDILTIAIAREVFLEKWNNTKPDFRAHTYRWIRTGLKKQDALDNRLAEFVDRTSR